MVPIRLSSFIFMLMFTLLEARDSIFKHRPLYHQGVLEAKITRNEIIEAKGIHQNIVAKEIKPIPTIPEEEGKKMMLNGRKLASKDEFKKEKPNTKEKELAKMQMDSRSSKTSGRNSSPSRMQSSKPKLEDKKTKEVTDEQTSNARKQKGKSVGTTNESFQKLKSHELEAANEKWTTLMNRDYPGNGGGRRNPPTNNR
ncbi:uncharacterized protein LOC110697596 [Chenopodium quinoa]|uniref:uncharacterized protein LOC110697596 n=1 Tax=Chenopodium quinoa TaxID=63459 RepID=UPI000B76BC1D|nr:uncharacterized protein LOC110697596 [Chenopodium quinoa]